MVKRVQYIVISILILNSVLALPISGENTIHKTSIETVFYVGGSGPGNYTCIQDAIDNASDNDTVYVYNGTYYENIEINKSIVVEGEDKNTTIIDGGGKSNVVDISANEVVVTGFTIQNSGINEFYAGFLINSINNEIFGNSIINNGKGIVLLEDAMWNKIKNNFISFNEYGIDLYMGSNYCTIIRNVIKQNNFSGIFLGSNYNEIIKNKILENNQNGINIQNSYNNISFNIISDNVNGIFIVLRGQQNAIFSNHITRNEYSILTSNFDIDRKFCFNYIYCNNFIENENIAYNFFNFRYLLNFFNNNFENNYWDRPRILPKYIPYFNFDWHPAKEQYDINV